MVILNDGSATHVSRDNNKRASAIDLTFCSNTIQNRLNWKVENISFGRCAHQLIRISLKSEIEIKNEFKKIICKQKVIQDVRKIKGNSFHDIIDLQNDLRKIVKNHTRKSKYQPKNWWCEDLKRLYEEKKIALREFNRASNSENLIKLNKAEALFVKRKLEEKRKNIVELINTISPQTTTAQAWKTVRTIKGWHTKSASNNGKIYQDVILARNFMMANFVDSPLREVKLLPTDHVYSDILNIKMWKDIIQEKSDKSAPGLDKITYLMLKNLQDEVIVKVIRELNLLYNRCTIPNHLKAIKIVAIPKQGVDPSLIESFRPISLEGTIIKILNCAVHAKMMEFINKEKLIPEYSFGFRKNRSTITCLGVVSNCIMNWKREGKIVGSIFFDLSNAFNEVDIDILVSKLEKMRFDPSLINWINVSMTNRPTVFEIVDDKIEVNANKGVPQGDINSPTLFNLYTSNFHKINDMPDTVLVQYADDFVGCVKGDSVMEVETKLKLLCDEFMAETEKVKLKINCQKTKVMIYKRSSTQINVKIRDTALERVYSYKYLGISFDYNLSFGGHIRTLKKKVTERLNMFKVINGTKHGSHPKTMLLIYHALITNTVMYGSAIYGGICKSYENMLDVTHRKALRIATGCTKSTPINSLAAISATEPLALTREMVTKKEIAKNIINKTPIAEQLSNCDRSINGQINSKVTFMQKTYWENEDVFRRLAKITTNENINTDVAIYPSLKDPS